MPDSVIAHRRASAEVVRRKDSRDRLTASAALFSSDIDSGAYRAVLANTALEGELWSFYYTLGEFGSFVDWMSRAMSLVRLGAAEQSPAADEPAMLKEGPAAELMGSFYGGTSGQSAFFAAMTPQLLCPGQGWLVPERHDLNAPLQLASWSVQSTQSFRAYGIGGRPQIQTAPGIWRDLMPDALPVRVWVPDPQFPYLAKSPAMACLPIMRRIDLLDKRIVTELLSRLAMNGILWMPQEAALPVSPQYADQPDPFVAELIDIAGRNVRNPGAASAAIPIPMQYPAEFIDKIRHTKFADLMDEHLLQERQEELGRLAKSLPLSQERQQGFGDANHWNGFLISEDDIKISIKPLAEIIANAVTLGFLQPLLAVSGQSLVGPNGGKIIAWPDFSELAVSPDRSQNTKDAYDRGEASGEALRRETGLDEADAPDAQMRIEQIWLNSAMKGFDPALTQANIDGWLGKPPPPQPVQPAPPTPAAAGVPGPDRTPAAAGTAPPVRQAPVPEPTPAVTTASADPWAQLVQELAIAERAAVRRLTPLHNGRSRKP